MKVLIIEDELIIAQDIKNILENSKYEVCGIANDNESALKLFLLENPDIIISDIYIKGSKNGIITAKEINLIKPTPILFITAYSSKEIIELITDFKDINYVTKPFTETQILASLEMMAARKNKAINKISLSERENEILNLILLGKSSQEISEELEIGTETVKTHKKRIFLKFGVSTSARLISLILHN